MPQKNLSDSVIQFYIDNGYTLFPLNGKKPPKGFSWPRAEYNPLANLADFPSGNFGVKLEADDLIIDIDPRNFNGTNPLEAFQKAINFRLKDSTYIVKTGGGGLHCYFKKPVDLLVKGELKEYEGIEFKSKGQYVVGAGSIHPDSKLPYTIQCDSPVADAPKALLDLIQKTEPVTAPGTGIAIYTDDVQTQNRFIRYLKTAPIAVEGENGDKTTFSVAAVGHDFGLSPDSTYNLMLLHYNPRCIPMWNDSDLRKKVYNAYNYSAGAAGTLSSVDKFEQVVPNSTVGELRMDQFGRITKNVYNTVVVFNLDCPGMLALNVFSEDITFLKPAPWHRPGEVVKVWTDEETARCKFYMSKERKFEPNTGMIEDAIINVARQHTFHPIKQYLEGMKWDNFPRLNNWLAKFCGVDDNPYSRSVGLKTLVAAVTRIYHPGHKFDYIPVLEGGQGIGKSRSLAILGGEWYGDITIDVHAKDTVDIMRRLWIIEVSEMETTFRTETQALKSFLSRSSDICRLAYGRRSKVFPRQNVFVGTINPENDEDTGWLKDTTGNRRYWPVLCKKMDVEGLRKVRDMLWAEAYLYYKSNTSIHFEDTAVEEEAMKEQGKRMGTDPWCDTIANWLNVEINVQKEIFGSNQIFCDCLGGRPTQFGRTQQMRIALVMKKLGWEKGLFHSPELNKPVRGYRRPI